MFDIHTAHVTMVIDDGSWRDSAAPLCTENLVAQLVDIVVPCSAASALVAPAASVYIG